MKRSQKVPNFLFLLFLVFWMAYFGNIWINAIQVRPDGWYSAYLPHWGDGAAHLSYMAAFAYRQIFPEYHPLFIFHAFTYSFAADLIGGLLTRAGLSLWFAYNLWGFILSILTLVGLWSVLKVITASNKSTFIAATLFLTSGGLGFKYLWLDRWNPASIPASPFFPLLLTQRENTDIAWLNTIVGELIPQRAFLLALPLGALLLTLWYRRFILDKAIRPWQLILTGMLFGLMPVIHPHTTMVLAVTIVTWGLLALKRRFLPAVRDLALIAVPTLLIGSYLTFHYLTPSVSSGFFKWYPGWLAGPKQTNWLIFWLDNWGLFLPVALYGTLFVIDHSLKKVLLPFWLWFILANLFLFQPYDWDNSKILTWVYLFFAIPVSAVLVKLGRQHLPGKILAVLLFIVLTLSGAIDAAKMLDTRTYALQLLNTDELKLGQIVRQQTSPEAVILTATTHRNWVPLLTGRQILCGYLGWMWTYGIDADQRVADIRAMYAGTALTPALLKQYGINYVVIGPEERYEFKPNEPYFAQRYPLLTQVGETTVYRIN